MEQSPSWEPNKFSASPEILRYKYKDRLMRTYNINAT
jgi:hypothetical protein